MLGITPDQYIALRLLRERKSQKTNQKVLAELMYTDPNNISNLVARMEKSGLIERIPFPEDKRQNHLRPTAMGIAKFNEARPVAEQLESQVMKAIDPKKRKDFFLKLMSKLNKHLNAER